MERKTKECAGHPRNQFCALAYRPKPSSNVPSGFASVIVFVIQAETGDLHFLVSPTLSQVVQDDDMAFIDSLLKDFMERAKLQPEDLFQQLCSLSVGPLVALEVGSRLAEHPRLQGLSSRFVAYTA